MQFSLYHIVFVINIMVLDIQGIKFFSFHNNRKRLVKMRSSTTESYQNIHTGWITQKLDHFDSQETRRWKMRFFMRLDFWKKNGPIYVILGGEAETHPDYISDGLLVFEMAKKTKGAVFMTEHRYYGESQPFKNRDVETMKYLTTPQTLADNAKLIRNIKKIKKFERSKVVVIGASYSGNLAAWMRLVYPNLVDAAIASSAPVLAKRDFYEGFEVINNDYKKYGTPHCLADIRSIFHRYDRLFKTKKGIKRLKKEENICEDTNMAKPENKMVFFLAKIDPFFGVVQDGNISLIHFHCKIINRTHKIKYIIDKTDSEQYWFEKGNCNAYDFNRLAKAFYEDKDEYPWVYQTCTEYGYFFSTTSDNQPFTKNMPVEIFDKFCTALYGESFDKERIIAGIRKTNQMYGGRYPNVTRVVFVNGELDPWSSLSVLKDISPETPAIIIPKASHCNDMIIEDYDSEEVKKARTHIKYLIRKWITAPVRRLTFEFSVNINVCKNC